jgi:hypothetical protein
MGAGEQPAYIHWPAVSSARARRRTRPSGPRPASAGSNRRLCAWVNGAFACACQRVRC